MNLVAPPAGRDLHARGRFTDHKGRRRGNERTRCGMIITGDWRSVPSPARPTCERCFELLERDREAA